jgi:preprotein translocase subunit SecA
VEGHNFDIRKQLLEYDNVANEQRQVIYRQRNELLEQDDISETIMGLRLDVVSAMVDRYIPPQSFPEQWDLPGIVLALRDDFKCELPIATWFEENEELQQELVKERIEEALHQQHLTKEALIGADGMRQFEKTVMLQSLDMHWREHLAAMDHLRQGIHLRGYAQKNPRQEYKREAFKLFSELIDRIKYHVISYLSCVVLQTQEAVELAEQQRLEATPKNVHYLHNAPSDLESLDEDVAVAADVRGASLVAGQPRVGRNDPCPCGSGRKYKQCHGEL